VAVESALRQEGVPTEVIVVDDGSTDDTVAIVEANANRWGRGFHYLRQPRGERGQARNNGIAQASGEYVGFLDSDDVWAPDHARCGIRLLEQDPEAVAAYGEYGLIDARGRILRAQVRRPRVDGRAFQAALCRKRLILHPSETIVRRHPLTSAPAFDADIPGAEDWLLWVRLARRGRFLSVGKTTVWMRMHSGGTFSEPEKLSRSLMKAAERVNETGLPMRVGVSERRILAVSRVHGSYAHYLGGQWAHAWQHLGLGLREDPLVLLEPDFLRVLVRLCVGPVIGGIARQHRWDRAGEHHIPENRASSHGHPS
jgi:hypothetical protein